MKAPIVYFPHWIKNSDESFQILSTELDWIRREQTPRMEYYINDVNVPYAYGSNGFLREYQPQVKHPLISVMQAELEKTYQVKFEACFLNRYINQSDHLGWHADDSPEMDPTRPIAIISLGVEREIWFRPNDNQKEGVERLKLQHGSMCLMTPGMQQTWQHRIPKCDRMCGERISLTFRGYKA